MSSLPIVRLITIVKNKKLYNFLNDRNVLHPNEMPAIARDINIISTENNLMGLGLVSFLRKLTDNDLASLEPEKVFADALRICHEDHGENLIFAHPVSFSIAHKTYPNTKAPGFIHPSIRHVINTCGKSPLVDWVRKACEPEFIVNYDDLSEDIRIQVKS